MNSRLTPWRQKPTNEIQNLIPSALEIRLYMLQELGPTSFVFKDDNGNKLRISIGKEISCSCNPHKKDHCIHTLYVFLKIFQFDQANPLIWQTSYIDNEIDEIIRNRYNPRKDDKIKKILPALKKRSASTNSKARVPTPITRIEIEENDICSICHESMKHEEGLTYCKKKCGNNFHLNCIMIWAEHKNSIGEKINCPMCRADWGVRAFLELQEEQEEFEARLILHKGHKCSACKSYGQKCIKGKLFHCVYCENYELCEKCFLSYEHFEHNKYLVKETVNDEWKASKSRDSVYMKSQDKKLRFAKDLGGLDKMPGVDYRIALLNMNLASYEDFGDDKVMSDALCIDTATPVERFLLTCFPDFGSEFDLYQGKSNSLAIIGREVRKTCCYCNSEKGEYHKLKRLFCGHLMHDSCLLDLFSKKLLTCPEDGTELLKGFRTAFYPHMQRSPPFLIEQYQLNKIVEEQTLYKKPSFESTKKNITSSTSMKKTRKIVSPNNKLEPLDLDITGKNLIRTGKMISLPNDSQLTTERFTFMKNDKKIMGNKFPKPPRNSQQGMLKKENLISGLNPNFNFIAVQGTTIPTNPSISKMETVIRRKEFSGREHKTGEDSLSYAYPEDDTKRGTIGGRSPSHLQEQWDRSYEGEPSIDRIPYVE